MSDEPTARPDPKLDSSSNSDSGAPSPDPGDQFSQVYHELKRLARSYLRGERANHTLQPTALVNEAYLRLDREAHRKYRDRNHFVAIAARAMRQILIDHARYKKAAKRHAPLVVLDSGTIATDPQEVDVLDLNRALDRLHRQDPVHGSIVELHFFGGLTVKETAEVLELGERTVHRRLRSSKAWLKATLLAPGSA